MIQAAVGALLGCRYVLLLEFDHLIPQVFQPVCENLLGFREHLVFFLLHVVLDLVHQHVKLGLKRLVCNARELHFDDQVPHFLMFQVTVRNELGPFLASLFSEGRVKEGVFELCV
jgi:hypothetical protein